MEDQSRKQSFAERYDSGEIPWDDQLPPPEVIALVEDLDPGRALDLGSGYGRTSIYLAQHGWRVDGIEFIPRAVEESNRRAKQATFRHPPRFHVADATDLSFLQGPYDLAIDVGCMHSMNLTELENYGNELKRLLQSGATFLLFAHLRDPADDSDDADRWIEEAALRALFADGFSLSQIDYGITQVPDRPPWPSAWLYFQRQ